MDELFDKFWSAYPRRVAKVQARKAWGKLNVDGELVDLMLKALEWQVHQWSEIQYVPHPATWLNGRRWEDERPTGAGIQHVPKGQHVEFFGGKRLIVKDQGVSTA